MDRRLATDLAFFVALVVSATLFYFTTTPVALLALAVFTLLAWARIDLALLAIVAFVPYFSHPKTILGHHYPQSEWLLLTLVVVAIVAIGTSFIRVDSRATSVSTDWRAYLRPQRPHWNRLLSSPFLWPGIIFLLAACISTVTAVERGLAARDLLEVIIEPMVMFALLLLFAPAEGSTRDSEAVSSRSGEPSKSSPGLYLILLALTVALTGVAPSLIALGQLVSHQHLVLISGAVYKRVPGPYGSPDNLGLLLDRTLPMALSLLVAPVAIAGAYLGRARSASTLGVWATRFILGAILGLMGAALLVTFVLGAWLATGIAGLAVLLVRFRPGWWVAAPFGLILVAGLVLGLGKSHGVTAGNRINIWQSAVHMIRDHPILGIGPDNFQHYYTPIRGDNVSPHALNPSGQCSHGLGYMERAASAEPCLSHPHNEVLDLWLSTGILGLVAFAWLQLVFWRIIWNERRALSQIPVLLGAAGAMLATVLHGLVDNVYFLVDLSLLFWVLLALANLHSRRGTSPTRTHEVSVVDVP